MLDTEASFERGDEGRSFIGNDFLDSSPSAQDFVRDERADASRFRTRAMR
jgi:hypothetical protein